MKDNCNKCSNCSSYVLPGAPCVNCNEGTPCQNIYNSSCVIYTGNCLECYGVQSGDTLTTVIDKLLEFVYPQCTTTTTTSSTTTSTTTSTSTTTTTTTLPCECFTVENTSPIMQFLTYTECDGTVIDNEIINEFETKYICARPGSFFTNPSVIITGSGDACEGTGDCLL